MVIKTPISINDVVSLWEKGEAQEKIFTFYQEIGDFAEQISPEFMQKYADPERRKPFSFFLVKITKLQQAEGED